MTDNPASAPQRGTGLAFVQHWDWVAEKGLMPRNTAMSIRAAISQMLKIDPGWESIDVRQIDVESLVARFRNLSKLAPGSLATYESRFRSGLQSYLAYLDNPASYQPGSRKPASGDRAPARQPTRGGRREAAEPAASTSASHRGGSTPRLIVYPFPVRSDVFAELKLPADLTIDEAKRLSAFLNSLAISSTDSTRDSDAHSDSVAAS